VIYSDEASGGTAFVEIIPNTGLVNTYEITSGIVADSVYQFKVTAVNVQGESAQSIASNPIRAADKPSQPHMPVKVSATTSTITISWNAPTYNGGNALTDYSVYISTATNDNYVQLASTGSPSVLTYQATGLTRGELYWFKVTAWNIIGESPYSEENSILAATVPLSPDPPTIAV
jgi:hypothetical protein